MHAVSSTWTYTPKLLYLQISNEVSSTVGMYHSETVRLAYIRSYLSQKLVIRHTCRSRELQFIAYPPAYLTGYIGSQGNATLVFGDIKKGLVNRQRLYNVGIVAKYLMYTL